MQAQGNDEITAVTDTAIEIARGAGAIALEGFRSQGLGIEEKRNFHDVVTEYDGACEVFIRDAILAAYPDSTIVGEEDGATVGAGALTWYVDPIDGTANYARGIAMWAVSIGIERDGEIVAGVIYDPVADHMFWADERGAFLGEEPISSAGSVTPERATVAMNFPLPHDLVHLPDLALTQFAQVTREYAQLRYLGSTCIALCWIAAGWVDATVSFDTNPWDVAAGSIIVRQAGGTFLGYRAGEPVSTRSHLAPNYYASVADGEYPALIDIMETQSKRPTMRPTFVDPKLGVPTEHGSGGSRAV